MSGRRFRVGGLQGAGLGRSPGNVVGIGQVTGPGNVAGLMVVAVGRRSVSRDTDEVSGSVDVQNGSSTAPQR